MAWRRFLYIAFLSASFLYYVFYTWYVSWIIFIFALLLPLLSVALTLISMRGCRVGMKCGGCQTEKGEGFDLVFYVESSGIPMTAARIKLVAENLFSGIMDKYEIYLAPGEAYSLHIDEEVCGVIRSSISRAHIMDLLGIFWLPVSTVQPIETLLLPEAIPFEGDIWPFAEYTGQNFSHISENGSEWLGVRDYREGDSLRAIHWKLTARKGETVVREYAKINETRCACAGLIWNGKPRELHRSLGRLFGVLDAFEKEGYRFRIFWIEQGEVRIITGKKELDAELWPALKDMPGEDRLLSKRFLAAGPGYGDKAVMLVSPDAVLPIDLSALLEEF
ncbi:DUF58 domain-containing protein [Christensenella tenuis]|uniref:DUF58 domain-containing protein n=1 Tax=Christensenella tenuis TaxID=2763033 RepID=A0ABR7ED94_9FIRM|nr:DUF58 domain-containing protein [Christensenella tenuis]MBC5647716.1 DUF58 domain-containing protein [Christensenella tenuis]